MSVRPLTLIAAPTLALLAGVGGWQHWMSTPAYALRELARGVESRDREQVLRHLDVDASVTQVVGSLMDAANAAAARQAAAQEGGGDGSAALSAAIMSAVKPVASAMAVQAVNASLASWTTQALADSLARSESTAWITQSFGSLTTDFATGSQRFVGIGSVTRWSDSASVDVGLAQAGLDTTLVIPVLLKKAEGSWKVVGLRNIGELFLALDELRTRKLSDVNGPIYDSLSRMVRVSPMSSALRQSGWFSQSIVTGIPVENLTDRRVVALHLTSPQSIADGAWTVQSRGIALAPGDTATLRNRLNAELDVDWHRQLAFSPERITMRPSLIVFETGAAAVDTARVFESWEKYVAGVVGWRGAVQRSPEN